jgi:serine/threonine protein kinase
MATKRNYEILKYISSGMQGEIYKIKYKNKIYALKKQKILKQDIDSTNDLSKIVKELTFLKWTAQLSKNERRFFAYPIEIFYSDNCKLDKMNSVRLSDDLKKSQYCVEIIMKLKDGTLQDLMKKNLSKSQRYSIMIQLVYAVYLMHKEGYLHYDMHTKNIVYKKTETDKKISIKFDDLKINTFGYQISIIDYGQITHKNFKHDETFNFDNERKYDFLKLLASIIGYGKWGNDVAYNKNNDKILNDMYIKYPDKYFAIKKEVYGNNYKSYFANIESNNFKQPKYDAKTKFLAADILRLFVIRYNDIMNEYVGQPKNKKFFIDEEDFKLLSTYENINDLKSFIKELLNKL